MGLKDVAGGVGGQREERNVVNNDFLLDVRRVQSTNRGQHSVFSTHPADMPKPREQTPLTSADDPSCRHQTRKDASM